MVNKSIIYIGILIIAVGLLWSWITKLPIGRLPGDLAIKKEGFQFYFPITTMVLISLVISLILWLFKK
jgi:hypothetical protein